MSRHSEVFHPLKNAGCSAELRHGTKLPRSSHELILTVVSEMIPQQKLPNLLSYHMCTCVCLYPPGSVSVQIQSSEGGLGGLQIGTMGKSGNTLLFTHTQAAFKVRQKWISVCMCVCVPLYADLISVCRAKTYLNVTAKLYNCKNPNVPM